MRISRLKNDGSRHGLANGFAIDEQVGADAGQVLEAEALAGRHLAARAEHRADLGDADELPVDLVAGVAVADAAHEHLAHFACALMSRRATRCSHLGPPAAKNSSALRTGVVV